MLAFLKRWRQAYLEDKGNRLHAELEEERNVLCTSPILEGSEVMNIFNQGSQKNEALEWAAAASKAMEDERNRERYY